MRVAVAVAVPLVAALLQAAVVPFVAIGDARPNLVILVAASWSVAAGAREAVWWAFVGGIAADLLSGGPLGAGALSALVPVAAVGLGDTQLRPRSVLAGAALVGIASFGAEAIYLVILQVAGVALGNVTALGTSALFTAVYDGVLAIATYPLFRALHRTTEKQASFGW